MNEKIELHKRLQGFYREKMGDLLIGDWVINPYSFEHNPQRYCLTKDNPHGFEGVIRLPLPIDPVNPERGLYGMLNNQDITLSKTLTIYRDGSNRPDYIKYILSFYCGKTFEGADPETALLKALVEQEGL